MRRADLNGKSLPTFSCYRYVHSNFSIRFMPMRMTASLMALTLLASPGLSAAEDASPYTVLITDANRGIGYELTLGGQLFYRSSKAALNMAMRTLSKEVPIPVITARESAENCITIIEGYTPDKSGLFFDYKGTELPW